MPNTYDEPIYSTYVLAGETLSAAGELAALSGPAGKSGRVVSISTHVTTSTTVADTVVSVNSVDNAVVHGSLTVPVATAPAVANASVDSTDSTLISADGGFTIDCDGGASAGVGTISVVVAWF